MLWVSGVGMVAHGFSEGSFSGRELGSAVEVKGLKVCAPGYPAGPFAGAPQETKGQNVPEGPEVLSLEETESKEDELRSTS